MAYSTLPTVVTGADILTSWGNAVKANFDAAFPLGVDGWTAYTPTLVQSGAVTKTVAYAKYQRVGRLITVNVLLNATGAGTAANEVRVGLPVTAAQASALCVGSGYLFDSSAALVYKGFVVIDNTSYVTMLPSTSTTAGRVGDDTFTAALASGDTISLSAVYEAAS